MTSTVSEANKVGVVTTSYPRGEDDWAGGFVRARVRALVAGGARVEVIAAGAPGDDAHGWPEPGVEVFRVIAPAAGNRDLFYGAGAPEVLEDVGVVTATAAAVTFATRLASAIAGRARDWRAVESHWLVPCALLASAAGPRRPHRAFAHGGDVALLERIPCGDALSRILAASGASLVFASRDLQQRFARLCGVLPEALRATVEPAAIDGSLFRPLRAGERAALRRGLGCTTPTVLAVGRLVPVKGFDLLVRAAGRLPRRRRPSVVLVGDGPERTRLERMAAARGVSLRLPGALPPAAVAAWMGAADVYAQPSRTLASGRSEGSPLAVREALAAGLPVVACAVGGLAELEPRDGATIRLVPADAAALADAIARFIQSAGAGTEPWAGRGGV